MVIPKDLRERAGLVPGVTVDFLWVDGRIVLEPVLADRPLGGRFAHTGMADRLLADRANEPR